MKSIIEEGSTLFKAIEKGWEKAGKPEEFTVRVFEKEERGFLGFSSKPAKIAILFNEVEDEELEPRGSRQYGQGKPYQKKQYNQPMENKEIQEAVKPIIKKNNVQPDPVRQARPQKQAENTRHTEPQKKHEPLKSTEQPKQPEPIKQTLVQPIAPQKQIEDEQPQTTPEPIKKQVWSDEMVTTAQTWLQTSLEAANLEAFKFKTKVDKFHIKFTFLEPVLESKDKEKQLFSSFAYLLMLSLRHKFKRELRGYKAVITSNGSQTQN
ncbi:MAG: hypothetical protein UR26_C0001G0035 [candidate division TM6 bacterium GW2011_GWF2_32_72]|nr:MAG: hypothetical protein UR26_C0001G0035 [candidate division TM6 bacterium GW2011_GWF2_32_72]